MAGPFSQNHMKTASSGEIDSRNHFVYHPINEIHVQTTRMAVTPELSNVFESSKKPLNTYQRKKY